MLQHEPTPRPTVALGGICSLLVLGLLVGASLSAVQPGIRDLQRDTAGQRAAVRQISETVAKAFREIVGDKTKPALTSLPRIGDEFEAMLAIGGYWADHGSPVTPLLRDELLSLPPPARLL